MQLLRSSTVLRRPFLRRSLSVAPLTAVASLFLSVMAPSSTQTAVANGDTRTLSLFHAHRKDSITVTFRRNGSYDGQALAQLNFFLRDWRNDQQTRMDPRLFDVIWEAQRGSSSSAPVIVLSAYRSPTTNAMLRSRSRAVAKESQHMYGKAMDMRMPDTSMSRVREIALRLQRGGVGWYGSSNFVHLDVGSIRAWPRLSYDHLARLFPDGKTVHIAADGRTLPGYEEARAVIAANGGAYVPTLAQVKEKSFFARLFGLEEDDEEAVTAAPARGRGRTVVASAAPQAAPAGEDGSAASFFRSEAARREPASAQVAAVAPIAAAPTPVPAAAPVAIAAPASPLRPAVRPEPVKAEPEPTVAAPLPPRRPSEQQIAALIQRTMPNVPNVPMPPQRPEVLTALAEAKPAKSEAKPVEPVAAAALVAIAAPPLPPIRTASVRAAALPSVITQGAQSQQNAAALNAAGLLSYAPTIPATGAENIRKVETRKPGTVRTAPVIARTVGVRGKGDGKGREVPLVAARLDRSNFTGLTDGRRISEQSGSSLIGSTVTGVRQAARHDPSRLLFAPADVPSQGFTVNPNPTRADSLAQPTIRQASAGSQRTN